MKPAIALAVACAVLYGGACSKGDTKPNASAAYVPPAKPAAPLPPATLTDVDVAAADMGGAVEEVTDSYGAGLMGRRLIDDRPDSSTLAPADWNPNGMYNKDYWAKYPQEFVFSFYERQPALVGAVAITPTSKPTVVVEDQSTAPKDVEVWTSNDLAPASFTKAGAATLEAKPGEQTVTFPATEAKFVKLRVLSGASERVLEIAEVRVRESAREGYVPLFTRETRARLWKGSPREGAQHGLDWLQQSAVDWTTNQKCFGCHVQAQALMGQAIALENHYRVSMPAIRALTDFMLRAPESPEGMLGGNHPNSAAVFGAMGFAHGVAAGGAKDDRAVFKVVDYVLGTQAPDGSIPSDLEEPPIAQGGFMLAANAVTGFEWAAAHSKDPKYGQAAGRAIGWLAATEPVTTQDRVFKVVALEKYGTPDQKRIAWSVVEQLSAQQQPDGGWKETTSTRGSNPFASGQVLYAFKQAGVSVRSPMFQRGVTYLLKTQVSGPTLDSGSWKATNTESQRKSDLAPTMWAVIGLAGAYGTDPKGALQIVRQGNSMAGRNLDIVLDVSGSMKTALGASTRWQTALDVLKEVAASLPEDMKVGLRVYGHRYPSKSAQTCQDTELVVPIARLDRSRIVNVASQLKPLGDTPLVRSALKTVDDLKAVGGGSVILITDGEESCGGDPKAAARAIKASGMNVSLNIVGFTLAGKATEAELSAFAASTGGHYYGAQDGAQLSRAVKLAALQRLPYDILDASGKVLVSGETSELSRELPPGQYRIRIKALDHVLEDAFTVVPNQTTTLGLAVEGDRFVMRR